MALGDSEENILIRKILTERIREIDTTLESLSKRDPGRNKLYQNRSTLREKLLQLDTGLKWETRSEILQRVLPTTYGEW